MYLRLQRQKTELFLTFIVGIVLGIVITKCLYNACNQAEERIIPFPNFLTDETYNLPEETTRDFMSSNDNQSYNTELSNRIYNETRVVCMVLTTPKYHKRRAIHIKRTWGKRCHVLLFMSTENDEELGSIKLSVADAYSSLWNKTREGLRYIYEHHLHDGDWFLKTDDDTYVIMENLRAFLYSYSPRAPVYFGNKLRANPKYAAQGYMSGGAGYVMSQTALRRFIEMAYKNNTICRNLPYGIEDLEIGRCLKNVGVVAGDSRDKKNLQRFFPLSPLRAFQSLKKGTWYQKMAFYKMKDQYDCCSKFAIAFHNTYNEEFYVLEYFIYRLRPFGIAASLDELPPKLNMLQLLEKWRDTKSNNLK